MADVSLWAVLNFWPCQKISPASVLVEKLLEQPALILSRCKMLDHGFGATIKDGTTAIHTQLPEYGILGADADTYFPSFHSLKKQTNNFPLIQFKVVGDLESIPGGLVWVWGKVNPGQVINPQQG